MAPNRRKTRAAVRIAAPAPAASATRARQFARQLRPALFGLATLGVIAGYPEPVKWLFFASLVALALLDLAYRLPLEAALEFDLSDALLAALILWGALSLTWSNNAYGGVQAVVIASASLILAFHLKSCGDTTLYRAMAIAIAAGIPLALATNLWLPREAFSGYGNSGYVAEAFVAALAFLWVIWCGGRWPAQLCAVGAGVLALGYLALFTPSAIELMVIGVFAAIASVALAFRRRRWLGWAALAAWLLTGALIATAEWDALQLTRRLLLRAELWVNIGLMIAAKPFFGHGLGSYIETYPLYKEAHGDWLPWLNLSYESYATESEAAHNEPLQLLAELGVVGLAGLIALVATILRGAVRRLAADPIAAAGGAALLAVLICGLIEYPFQRCATLALAVIGWGFALHGRPSGVPRWRLALPGMLRASASAVAVVAALALGYVGLRQYAAETLFYDVKRFDLDASERFALAYRAHLTAPWERGIRAALPVALEGMVQQQGTAAIPRGFVEAIDRLADAGARLCTAALVARIRYRLDIGAIDDAEFQGLMADLHRGSARVAAVYALDARLALARGKPDVALATLAQGRQFTQGSSTTPEVDVAVRRNFDELTRTAQAMLQKR